MKPSPHKAHPPLKLQPLLPVALLILVGIGLRFYALGRLSLWIDEGYTSWLTSLPLLPAGTSPGIFQVIGGYDNHPPLFYLLLKALRMLLGLGSLHAASVFWLRFPSVIFGILTLPVLYALARRLLDRPAALWTLGLYATSAAAVFWTQEARSYSLFTFLVLAAFTLATRMAGIGTDQAGGSHADQADSSHADQADSNHAEKSGLGTDQAAKNDPALGGKPLAATPPASRPGVPAPHPGSYWSDNILYLIVATAALYTHYIALLALAGINLYALAFRKRIGLPRWLALQAAVLVLFIPWLPMLHQQLTSGNATPFIQASPLSSLQNLLVQFLLGFTNPLPLDPHWFYPLLIGVMGLLALGAARIRKHPPALALLAAYVVFPVAVLVVLALATPIKLLLVRYMIFILPGLFILAGAAFLQTRHRALRLAQPVLGGALVLINLLSLAGWYTDPTFLRQNWTGLTSVLRAQAQPKDLILIQNSYSAYTLDYYFRGALPSYYPDASRPAELKSALAGHPRAWLILSFARQRDPQGVVFKWMRAHCRLAAFRRFPNRASPDADLWLYLFDTTRGPQPEEESAPPGKGPP